MKFKSHERSGHEQDTKFKSDDRFVPDQGVRTAPLMGMTRENPYASVAATVNLEPGRTGSILSVFGLTTAPHDFQPGLPPQKKNQRGTNPTLVV